MSTLTPTQALPALAGFTFRHYRGEADVPAMLAVVRASKAADGHEDTDTLAGMLNQYRHLTNADPDRDVVLVEGPGGVVAYGRTYWVKEDGVDAYQYPVVGFVRPEARGKGIGRTLLAWLETRALAMAAEQGHPPAAQAYWQS